MARRQVLDAPNEHDEAEPSHAFLYARVSSLEQASRGSSLAAQLAVCRTYADERGWMEHTEHWDVLSGSRDDRPGYTELLRQVHQARARGCSAVIVVAALDRLGRRLVESVRVHAELRSLGVDIHAVREGGVLPDLLMNVLAAVAEEEVQRIARRIAAVRERQVANGWYVANRLPYGYVWRPATPEERAELAPQTVPEVDPLAAETVRLLFERAAQGEKLHTLLPTRFGSRDEQKELARWIGHMLRTPTYVARPWKGDPEVLKRPVSRWPALVDDATWEQVQMRFARRSYARGRHLLSGFLRCGVCGHRADIQKTGSRFPKRPLFACSARGHPHTSLGPEPQLDLAVMRRVRGLVSGLSSTYKSNPERVALAWRQVQARVATPRADLQWEAVSKLAERRLRSAGGLLAGGTLDPDGYELVREHVEADLELARARLDRAQLRSPDVPSFDWVMMRLPRWESLLANSSAAGHREVLALLVWRIYSHRLGFRKHRVHIDWSPLGKALRQCRRRMRSLPA